MGRAGISSLAARWLVRSPDCAEANHGLDTNGLPYLPPGDENGPRPGHVPGSWQGMVKAASSVLPSNVHAVKKNDRMRCPVRNDLDRTHSWGIAESAEFGAEQFQSSTPVYPICTDSNPIIQTTGSKGRLSD